MLQTAHHAPLLPALVGQLLGTDRPPAPRLSEKRRTRMEKMLVLLLEHGNLRRSRFALLLEVSESTAYDDAAALLADGLVSSWVVKRGTAQSRWYGLTPAGIARAKELKEMES
jgi:Mn-dependent DtxR family transcriptional regulator